MTAARRPEDAPPTHPPAAIEAAFDRRLDARASAPLAVAFSGGGDSLAALVLTLAWARPRGRAVLALHVDHRLQTQSPAWSDFAGRTAARLGARFQPLAWEGPKPLSGLAAAARRARHQLVAEAAREAGARVVVFGHTADDVLESGIMRREGSTVGAPREWVASPVWPEGRGIFLFRPLLTQRRAALRALLGERGETWIDDPANDDQRSPRARARRRLSDQPQAASGPRRAPWLEADGAAALARRAACGPGGFISIPRSALRQATAPALRRFVGAACVCAGGAARPPRGERVSALAQRLAADEDGFTATLAGARVAADPVAVVFARDAGETARGGLAVLRLNAGRSEVWDGRFLLVGKAEGAVVGPLKGEAAKLDRDARRRLGAIPAAARPALPLVDDGAGGRVCPVLADGAGMTIQSLVADRLWAACGAISKEPAI